MFTIEMSVSRTERMGIIVLISGTEKCSLSKWVLAELREWVLVYSVVSYIATGMFVLLWSLYDVTLYNIYIFWCCGIQWMSICM